MKIYIINIFNSAITARAVTLIKTFKSELGLF